MDILNHRLCNTVLLGDPDEGVADLPITRGKLPDGILCVRSYWKPSPEELADLNANGCIILSVFGSTHPPLRMDVAPV